MASSITKMCKHLLWRKFKTRNFSDFSNICLNSRCCQHLDSPHQNILSRIYLSNVPRRLCRQCANEVENENLTCSHCGSIQNVDKNVNYFKLFDMKQGFTINTSELADKFKVLQGRIHPDKFSGKSELEQKYSLECSSLLNIAYKTLLHPLERGEYLLNLNKQEISETGMDMEKDFLMEIMEINEILAERQLDMEELRQINKENKIKIKETLEQLIIVFTDNNLEQAKMLLAKLKYFVNIETKIKSLELKFGIVY